MVRMKNFVVLKHVVHKVTTAVQKVNNKFAGYIF
jgi:ribosomal protein S17E